MGHSVSPLAELTEAPASSALFTDVDGTLAAITPRPDEAAVPERASRALYTLGHRMALVACVSGRPALEARRMVGVNDIAYAGNHGIELLMPGRDEPELQLGPEERAMAAGFVAERAGAAWEEAGLRLEDKGPIQALHWRGAPDEAVAAELAEGVAAEAAARGLGVHRGRKVIELRPPEMPGKDGAVAALLEGVEARAAAFAGDDATDVDAFRCLRRIREAGGLERAVAVAIGSDEAPAELEAEADVVLSGPEEWIELLAEAAA